MSHSLFAFIIVLGILVFFHELGHFLLARFFGVGVETFSLGFGPKIYKKKVGLTEYCISIIPLGGYVKMVGEDPNLKPDDTGVQQAAIGLTQALEAGHLKATPLKVCLNLCSPYEVRQNSSLHAIEKYARAKVLH